MKAPRGLSAEEARLWAQVAQTVTPLSKDRRVTPPPSPDREVEEAASSPPQREAAGVAGSQPSARSTPAQPAPQGPAGGGLDSSWDRKLARAAIDPDFTLDLHGHTLDQAHRRLDLGLGQAKANGARLVLLITGRPRPAEAADRATRRGAIRAKVLDWLAAGPHAADIAAIRKAHRRHGGEGALYLVLKRRR